MKIAHFSDLHYGPAKLEEADRCFSAAVDAAIGAGVDAAVLSGDATDHALELHAPASRALGANLRRLCDHCPVLMLQGTFSHEPPGTLALLPMLGGRFPLYVAERLQQVALDADGNWLASAGWRFAALPERSLRAVFSCLPTTGRGALAAALGAGAAELALGEQLGNLLAGLAPLHRQAQAAGIPCIGVGHGTVHGCLSEHDVPMAGLDHEFSCAALFASGADAFMLGHIHKHQTWQRGGQLVAYPGSIGRFHYGESGAKGFLLWEVEAGKAAAELVPTPARRTVDIVFAGPPDMGRIAAEAGGGALDGAAVRVRWQVPEEQCADVDRAAIAALLGGAAEVKMEGRVIPLVRTRAPGIAQAGSVAAKLSAWAAANELDPAPLVDCLAALDQYSAEEIAQTIVALPPDDGGGELRPAPGPHEAQGERLHAGAPCAAPAALQLAPPVAAWLPDGDADAVPCPAPAVTCGAGAQAGDPAQWW